MSKQANHPNSTAVLEEEDLQEPDFDVAAVIGELPVIPRRILPKELEIHLELSAEQLDLNYEAAFCQFLINGSIALGGRKRIRIEETVLRRQRMKEHGQRTVAFGWHRWDPLDLLRLH